MIYDIRTMTKQEVFDAACNHLLTQNQKSMYSDQYSLCAYRGPNGLKCAAGIFIPDENYNYTYENHIWSALVDNEMVPPDHAELIDELQKIHDKSPIEAWKGNLQRFARLHDLQFYF